SPSAARGTARAGRQEESRVRARRRRGRPHRTARTVRRARQNTRFGACRPACGALVKRLIYRDFTLPFDEAGNAFSREAKEREDNPVKKLILPLLAAAALTVPAAAAAHDGHHHHFRHAVKVLVKTNKMHKNRMLFATLTGTGTTFTASSATASGSIASDALGTGTFSSTITTDWTKTTTHMNVKHGTLTCAPATGTLTLVGATTANTTTGTLTGRTCTW